MLTGPILTIANQFSTISKNLETNSNELKLWLPSTTINQAVRKDELTEGDCDYDSFNKALRMDYNSNCNTDLALSKTLSNYIYENSVPYCWSFPNEVFNQHVQEEEEKNQNNSIKNKSLRLALPAANTTTNTSANQENPPLSPTKKSISNSSSMECSSKISHDKQEFESNKVIESFNFNNKKNNLISLEKFERITVLIKFLESSENIQGNYQNYVYYSIKTFLPFQKIDYEKVLNKKTKYYLPTESSNSNSGLKKKTLVLDLDETLIHSDFDNITGQGIFMQFTHDGINYPFELFIRPFLQQFLQKASENFELVIFTASKREYADIVINYIDPENKLIKNRLYREDCISIKNKVFIKDLRLFKNRALEDIVILDNSMYSFVNQLSNAVLINSFYKDSEDKELINVLGYLENYLVNAPDIRKVNDQLFGFNDILLDIMSEQVQKDF